MNLALHECIGRRFTNGILYRWEFVHDGRELSVAPSGPLILNDHMLVLDAARSGIGLAYCLEEQASADLASGNLVRVLDDWCPRFPGFFLYYPSRLHQRPALQALIDFFRFRPFMEKIAPSDILPALKGEGSEKQL